ncbi:hypothetical protein J6V85_04115 [Candidatus Saccharibacteria bacterium]|nr:hypothetical protein [Candidatus Saccharibacteria bacterium]
MTVTLYKSPGERNILGRAKTVVKTLSAVEATDVLNIETPELLIDRDDSIIGFDYAHIAAFNRYYFLNSMEVVNGNQFKLYLESDPLESFSAGINSSKCIARRSSNHPNPEIEDPLVVFKNIPEYDTKKCATGFSPDGSGHCYVLTLGGK